MNKMQPTKVMMITLITFDIANIFISDDEHFHATNFNNEIRQEVKIEIQKMNNAGTNKTQNILNALRLKNIDPLPSAKQIQNFLSYYRTKLYGVSKISGDSVC